MATLFYNLTFGPVILLNIIKNPTIKVVYNDCLFLLVLVNSLLS